MKLFLILLFVSLSCIPFANVQSKSVEMKKEIQEEQQQTEKMRQEEEKRMQEEEKRMQEEEKRMQEEEKRMQKRMQEEEKRYLEELKKENPEAYKREMQTRETQKKIHSITENFFEEKLSKSEARKQLRPLVEKQVDLKEEIRNIGEQISYMEADLKRLRAIKKDPKKLIEERVKSRLGIHPNLEP